MQSAGESILDHLNWCTPFLPMRSRRNSSSANLWFKLETKQEHVKVFTLSRCAYGNHRRCTCCRCLRW